MENIYFSALLKSLSKIDWYYFLPKYLGIFTSEVFEEYDFLCFIKVIDSVSSIDLGAFSF